MIWAADDVDPLAGDEIKVEMAGGDPEEIEPLDNRRLDAVLEFYDCYHLLAFAQRVNWLSGVKEALGIIPESFKLSYMEIQALVVLNEEIQRKSRSDTYKMKQDQQRKESANLAQMVGRK